MTRRSGKIFTEKSAPRSLASHQIRGTVGFDGTEATQSRVVPASSHVALAEPRDLLAGVEDDVVPTVDLSDHPKSAAAPLGKFLDSGLLVRSGQDQFVECPLVMKVQGPAMILGRVGSTGRISDDHHVIAADATCPTVVAQQEANRSLPLDVQERTLPHARRRTSRRSWCPESSGSSTC
jgi:hypothetical protein